MIGEGEGDPVEMEEEEEDRLSSDDVPARRPLLRDDDDVMVNDDEYAAMAEGCLFLVTLLTGFCGTKLSVMRL